MAAQARRRKPKKPLGWSLRLPRVRIPWRVPIMLAVMGVFVWLVFELAQLALQQPIRALEIEGSFQRVTPLDVEAVLQGDLARGFFAADLRAMRARLERHSWIDSVRVRRRWPDTLQVSVVEHVAAARWGESGLLNTRGELFVADARHVPAELPRLSGPPGSEGEVAAQYLRLRARLAELGLRPASLVLDPRGSWQMTLANGAEVRFGRQDLDARTDRFLMAAAGVLANRLNEVEYVDMRYSNGFSVGWAPERVAAGGEAAPNG